MVWERGVEPSRAGGGANLAGEFARDNFAPLARQLARGFRSFFSLRRVKGQRKLLPYSGRRQSKRGTTSLARCSSASPIPRIFSTSTALGIAVHTTPARVARTVRCG